jgi:hypothetical protein
MGAPWFSSRLTRRGGGGSGDVDDPLPGPECCRFDQARRRMERLRRGGVVNLIFVEREFRLDGLKGSAARRWESIAVRGLGA